MITIRHIERTPLDEYAVRKLTQKILHTKKNIIISFDDRIKDLGQYTYNGKKKTHVIRISPEKNSINYDTMERFTYSYYKQKIFDTLIHELRHAQQRERLGKKFRRKGYQINLNENNAFDMYFFSPVEMDVRNYIKKNIKKLKKMYNEYKKKGKKIVNDKSN